MRARCRRGLGRGSVVEVGAKVWDRTTSDTLLPLLKLSVVHLPELRTEVEVSHHCVAFSRLNQRLCQDHVWTEAIELWRPASSTRSQQSLLGSLQITLFQRDQPKRQVTLVNGVAVVPILTVLGGSGQQFFSVGLRFREGANFGI